MIIVRISGGLGNQMFQYALGRALSIKNDTELVLDISNFNYQKKEDAFRKYTLDVFNISGRIAKPEDFINLGITNPGNQNLLAKIKRKIERFAESKKLLASRKTIIENQFLFIPEILEIKESCFLIGVWQSEKYFEAVGEQIRRDFKLKTPLSTGAEMLRKKISINNSVAIHVRRGDQVSNPHLAKKHGILNEDYYISAVDYIKKRVPSSHLYIFSDDTEWAKKNLQLGENVTYISDFALPDYEELTLMSLCKHAIIAKSSYSWWGAWLNENPQKIIITPKNRFGTAGNDDDLIPKSWIRI